MYYCRREYWPALLRNLYRHILAPAGAIHCALMASDSRNAHSTTWLYNHFAGKYFGHRNDQSLPGLRVALRRDRLFAGVQLHLRTRKVHGWVDDFEKFMAIVWMILLYPNVHPYTLQQRRDIARYMYAHFFKKRQPLIQVQDHLILYRGIPFKGLA